MEWQFNRKKLFTFYRVGGAADFLGAFLYRAQEAFKRLTLLGVKQVRVNLRYLLNPTSLDNQNNTRKYYNWFWPF